MATDTSGLPRRDERIPRATPPESPFALFDDPHKAGDVLPRLDKESRDFADVYRMSKEGAHGVEVGLRVEFIRQAEKLARWLQARP